MQICGIYVAMDQDAEAQATPSVRPPCKRAEVGTKRQGTNQWKGCGTSSPSAADKDVLGGRAACLESINGVHRPPRLYVLWPSVGEHEVLDMHLCIVKHTLSERIRNFAPVTHIV